MTQTFEAIEWRRWKGIARIEIIDPAADLAAHISRRVEAGRRGTHVTLPADVPQSRLYRDHPIGGVGTCRGLRRQYQRAEVEAHARQIEHRRSGCCWRDLIIDIHQTACTCSERAGQG